MSVQGFKNFMKITLFNDDSFQPLLKRNDQYRKTTQLSIDHYQSIVKNFDTLEISFGKILGDYDHLIDSGQLHVPQYYHEYTQLYRNIHIEVRYFSQKLSNNFKELTSLCSNIFTNYSNLILSFQGTIRSYKSHQQILCELSKKYFRTHKNMISLMESYKSSFTDVKLIYNMDEKNKRFNACEGTFRSLSEELEGIQQKVRQLNDQRQLIMDSYSDICKQFKIALKTIGNKLIAITKSFVADHCALQKSLINYLSQKKFTLQKIDLKTFFHSDSKFRDQQFFNIEIDRSRCEIFPSFVVYCDHIRDQSLHGFNKLALSYVKDLQAKIQERNLLNKKIFQVTSSFLKIYQRHYHLSLKEIMANFQKIKKKMSETFGGKLSSFMKSIYSVFDISVGINEKLIKRTPSKFKIIENALSQETKIQQMFIKELKSSIDKFLKKKQIKKIIQQGKQGDQFTEQQIPQGDILAFKKQLKDLSSFLTHLIQGFVDKIRKNQEEMKFQYNAFVNDVFVSINEIYSLCCDYQDLYFGEVDFLSNFKKYQIDIDKALQNQAKFFEEINFGILLKPQENPKITFESEMNKVDEYKKIRKPVQIQMEEEIKRDLTTKDAVFQVKTQKSAEEPEIERKISIDKSDRSDKKEKIQKQTTDKHEQFLGTKVQYLPNEKFLKSFSCGLSDKIILTGRLYITNKRLCFHSNFNPSNVFFGETFLQIPRKDIRKIQKRFNAIVFDNSISVTTVHGQVFFTSFFSRNQAYDLICQAMDLNQEQVMFEPQEMKEQPQVQVCPVSEQDDLNEESVALRHQILNNHLAKYDYKELLKCEFCSPGLNAFKILKLFQLGQQFTYNRKTYKSWAVYYKDVLEHKDYEFGQWTPNIYEYMNSSNIKKNTPQKFTRRVTCSVPIKNSGVPFMPKSAKSQQSVTIFIFSKDKYVVESSIQNSGVPYSDTFSIKMRRIYQTAGQNKCKMTVQIYINFVSDTIMRSMIQSKSIEESRSGFIKYDEEVSKYLRYLQKMKAKVVKSDGSGKEEDVKNNGAVQELEKQINQLKQVEQKASKQLKLYKEKQEITKKLFIGSLLLNIILILILIA